MRLRPVMAGQPILSGEQSLCLPQFSQAKPTCFKFTLTPLHFEPKRFDSPGIVCGGGIPDYFTHSRQISGGWESNSVQ